jgi:hypothetical protein
VIAEPMNASPVRGHDAEAQLSRALVHAAAEAAIAVAVETLRRRPWWSATFTGTRLALLVTAPRAPALGRWLADLPLADLPLRDHFVGSLALDAIEDDGHTVCATLTALVVED